MNIPDTLTELFVEFETPWRRHRVMGKEQTTPPGFFSLLRDRVTEIEPTLSGRDQERANRLLRWLAQGPRPLAMFRAGVWFTLLCSRENRLGRQLSEKCRGNAIETNRKKQQDTKAEKERAVAEFEKLRKRLGKMDAYQQVAEQFNVTTRTVQGWYAKRPRSS